MEDKGNVIKLTPFDGKKKKFPLSMVEQVQSDMQRERLRRGFGRELQVRFASE